MEMHKLIKTADTITLLSIIAGISSIFLSIQGKIDLAAIMIFAAVFFDTIDGKIARKFGPGQLGKDLDSLADTISFGVAPAIMGYMINNGVISVIILLFFVSCGALRLARYNITKQHKNVKNRYYEGMPITINGIIIPMLYFVGLSAQIFPYVFLISGILMISTIKIKKII